jgi:hypothetical protein
MLVEVRPTGLWQRVSALIIVPVKEMNFNFEGCFLVQFRIPPVDILFPTQNFRWETSLKPHGFGHAFSNWHANADSMIPRDTNSVQ